MVFGYKVIAIIPAKGNSRGVPNKNIRLMNGKPLIQYTIEQAKQSKYIDEVYVTTEDSNIQKISCECGAKIIDRPSKLAQHDTNINDVIRHVLHTLKVNDDVIIVHIPPTTPLRSTETIDKCIEKLINTDDDGIITIHKIDEPPQWLIQINEDDTIDYPFNHNRIMKNRQQYPDYFIMNNTVYVYWSYVIRYSTLMDTQYTLGYIITDMIEGIDINTELDFEIAEYLMKQRGIK